MAIQTLNNNVTLLEQRTKINANFSELDTRAGTAQTTADGAVAAASAAQATANGKFTKPGPGIASSDMTTAVQSSLALADSALQPGDSSTELSDAATIARTVGTYTTLAALISGAAPAANPGKFALVGASAPYTRYVSDGATWIMTVGAYRDPVTGLDVLDAGSAQLMAMGGAFAGATGKLTKTYTAIKRVMDGMGNAFYGLAGDSTTLSAGAGTSTKGLTGAATNRYAAQMAAYLTSVGVPSADNWFGGEGMIQAFQGVNYATYDPRFTVSGAASYFGSGGAQSVAGVMWQLNSTGKAISYTPQIAGANSNYDTVKIWYCNRTTGSFTVSQPGGGSTAQTITTTAAASTIGSTTVALTRGSGICNLTWASGDNWIIGAVFYDSQVPRLNIMTFGNYGDRLTSTYGLANNASEWRGGAVIANMALDGCFVDMSINHIQVDGVGGISAFTTALTTVANDIVGSGADLILSTPHNIGTANQGATSDGYVAAIKSVAASVSGAQVFDAYAKFTPYATYSATLYYDTLHLSIAGYGAKGRQAGRFLRQLSGA